MNFKSLLPFLCWKNTSKWAWFTLVYLLGVIIWGSFVRASGSGAGCGSHWPLCNGQVIPLSANSKTWIEFTHRITSGISLILCVTLFWSSFRQYPKGSFTRKAGFATLILIFMEALLGAGLVLLELVAENKSLLRTLSLGVHLLNTFFLVSAVALTARWAKQESSGKLMIRPTTLLISNRGLGFFSILAVVGILSLGVTGAMTALGDTLFPAASVAAGWKQDVSASSHFLIQLRVLHPVIAVVVTFYMIGFSSFLRKTFSQQSEDTEFFATLLAGFQVAQLLLGTINILLLAPTGIQLGHLLFADLIWLALVLSLASVWVLPREMVRYAR